MYVSIPTSILLHFIDKRVDNFGTDKPVQMEEAAESRISLSTRPSANRYTDNADVDAEASVGLLSNEPLDSSESEVKGGSWRKEKKMCMCCGVE